uniref:DUF58 domain-containing protein n=1 Tax=Streptomyces sp. YIM 98790 TaxID=2689077 RepID=UPI0037DDC494
AGPADGSRPRRGSEDRGPLRAAFSGLTTRGRSFLAAGGAAALCAYVLGQPDLLRVGALLAALPLVCVLTLYYTRSRVSSARRMYPSRVPAGSESRVELRIENIARVPTGVLLLQDRVPYVLGPRPRFVLDRIEPGGRREVAYRVRSELRGRYPLGPLQLRLTDPFGMVELSRSFTAFDVLTVLPRTEPLPPVRFGGDAGGSGETGRRALSLAGDEDIIPRDYRHGDGLRRVHWRSTAHRGQLMVRREEQPQRDRCTVLLDTRRSAYQGSGPGSAFERAVSGAASVVAHLLARDYSVRLVTDTGAVLPGPHVAGVSSAEAGALILDELAVLDHSPARGFEGISSGSGPLEEAGLLIAFLGSVNREAAPQLAPLRQRATHAVALVAAGQREPEVEAHQLRRLTGSGWLALPHHPGIPLGQLWQDAARLTRGPAGG